MMLVDCQTCPVRDVHCADCMVTALNEIPLRTAVSGRDDDRGEAVTAPLDRAERRAVSAFLGAGLVASFFHLGRPERAWRAAAMWRTSWLSREVIVLPAFMGLVFLYGIAHFAEIRSAPSTFAVDTPIVVGVAGAIGAIALYICTAMIYS